VNEKRTFTMLGVHLELLKRVYVDWDRTEFGAPCVDPKRPYGNSDVLDDMAEILGLDVFTDRHGSRHLTENQEKFLRELHEQTETALQIVLRMLPGPVEIGRYEADKYEENWKWVG
jgi:hypothetical protein